MKNLIMEFMDVTEAAAFAFWPWVGRGLKNEADEAATEAMRNKLNQLDNVTKWISCN